MSRREMRQSALRRCRSGIRRQMSRAHSSTDTSWDSTVASAAPPTPVPRPPMKATTSATLSVQAMMRKYSGVRLSPSARITELR